MSQLTGGPWIELYEVCTRCKGSGPEPGTHPAEACHACHGKGKISRDITLPYLKKMLRETKYPLS